jgi:imidazolonepropionase-like amidohydrolase
MTRDVPPGAKPVVFLDPWGTLLKDGAAMEPAPGAERLLESLPEARIGILCNAPRGQSSSDLARLLEFVGLGSRVEAGLVVVASDPFPRLPDRRAFAMAAALAEAPIGDCVYFSRDAGLRLAAAAAGMRVVGPDAPAHEATAAPGAAFAEAGTLLGPAAIGEVDEDTGPSFALEGRVVTMDDGLGVIDDGRVVVSRGKIVAVGPVSAPLPQGLANVRRVATKGTIYPGLMDLHNHYAYNVLPLWVVPRRKDGTPYSNRSQWPKHREYKPNVSAPLSLMAGFSPTAEAIVRYVEAKALIGGTTTGQGIRGKSGVKTTLRMYHGAMRNVEETADERLPDASSMVPNLQATNPKNVDSFRNALERLEAYFYHLSEGVDDEARGHFLALKEHGLIAPSLVGVHALGLRAADLRALGNKGAKVVWSPFSNQLLYEGAMDLGALVESGSTNLLLELKVARYQARRQDAALTSEDLVRAVTSQAASALGWHAFLGRLKPGALADLLVVGGTDGDPYDHLIDATERDVALVVIHGVARYGDEKLLERLHFANEPPEPLVIGGKRKLLHTHSAGSMINHVSLAAARQRLEEAMGDLPAFRQRVEEAGSQLRELGLTHDEGFTLVLDNEFDEQEGSPTAFAPDAAGLAAEVVLPKSIELDGLEAGAGTFWDRVEAQPNLPADLKAELRGGQ